MAGGATVLMSDVMEETGNDIFLPAMQEAVVDGKMVFTEELYNSLFVEAGQTTRGGATLLMGSEVDYALAVEQGADPHSPDYERLVDWVMVKNGVDEPTARRVAASIQDSIEENGTVPHPFIMPQFEATKKQFVQATLAKFKLRMMGI